MACSFRTVCNDGTTLQEREIDSAADFSYPLPRSVQRLAFDKARQAIKLLVQHAVDLRRPLIHSAADISADDIALRDPSAAFGRLQGPSKGTVNAFHLQRTEST